MKNIAKEYCLLFNEVTDVSEELSLLTRDLTRIIRRLMIAQQRTEKMFIEDEDEAVQIASMTEPGID